MRPSYLLYTKALQIQRIQNSNQFKSTLQIQLCVTLRGSSIFIKNAFVDRASGVGLYIQQLEGFVSKEHSHKVLPLNRALYGLKQSPRIWYLCFCHVNTSPGFEIMETDNSIYISTALCIILTVYVDDILIFSK